MWYRYFSKKNWRMRLWRSYNLKFDSNEFGISSLVYLAHIQAFIMKLARTEAPVRTLNVFLFFGLFKTYSYLSAQDPEEVAKREKEIADKEKLEGDAERKVYRSKLFINRYDAPTKPTQSIEDLIEFTSFKTAMDDAIDYMSLNEAGKNLHDFGRGLDTWLGDEDRKMMLYAKEFKAASH